MGGKAKKQREQRSGGQKAHANHCAHVHNDSQSLLAVLDAQKIIMTPGLHSPLHSSCSSVAT